MYEKRKEETFCMAKIESTLLDNSPHFHLVDKLKQLIAVAEVKDILIATGYWDIPGTALIAKDLSCFLSKDDTSVKLLIGKDPVVFVHQLEELKRPELRHTKDVIKINLQELKPKPEYEEAVHLLKKYCEGDNPRFSIHTFSNPDDERQFFHSKCYIFAEKVFTSDESAHGLYAIVGSSNFTKKGLEGNSELNYLEIQSQYSLLEVHSPVEVAEMCHHDNQGDRLRDDGSPCCSCNSHIENKDEYRVKNGIQDDGEYSQSHGLLWISC